MSGFRARPHSTLPHGHILPGLAFYPAMEEQYLVDPRTQQYLRVDGFFKNAEGSTLYAALSAPGSTIPQPDEVPALSTEASA